jgi:AcrR family transcriptional regulator
MSQREQAPELICDLLQKKRSLDRDELSARWVAKALGQTTGVIYHHWGSFDGFLLEVSGIGWERLVTFVVDAYRKHPAAQTIARSYVDFALAYPVLYWLLAERPLPRDVVRSKLDSGSGLPSFAAFGRFLVLLSEVDPTLNVADARALHAAAHGLASQMLSGRLLSTPDVKDRDIREVAYEVADAIAGRMLKGTSPESPRSLDRDPKEAAPASRPKTRRRSSAERGRR